MAGRKRKTDAAWAMEEEEADRVLYGALRDTANSLSLLYTLARGTRGVASPFLFLE